MKKITDKTKDSFRQAMGGALKERREAAGISQAKIAEVVGISQSRIPELERGETKNIDTWIACVTALGGRIKIEWE